MLWFIRLKLADKIVVAREVVMKMTDNPVYPTPSPTLPEMKTAADEAEVAMQEASTGDRIKIAVRNVKNGILTQKLRDIVAYVQGNCGNSEANVISAGLRVRRTRTPVGMLLTPRNPRLGYTGMTGELLFQVNAVRNKLNYTIQQSETAEGPYVTIATSSSSRTVLKGFTPAKQYWIRACANGTKGPGPFCPPVSAIAV